MTEKIPRQMNEEPTLGDVLQLENTIEALGASGLRDISEDERIALNTYPEGRNDSHGRVISHICKSQRRPNGGYGAVMNYMIIRDDGESSTRIIKRPPFSLEIDFEKLRNSTSEERREISERASGKLALYQEAQSIGLYDVTAEEVQDLTQTIMDVYGLKD